MAVPQKRANQIVPNARQLAFVYAGFRIKREGKQARIYGGKVLLCDSSLKMKKTMSKEKTKGLLAGERCGEKHTDSIASMRGMRFASWQSVLDFVFSFGRLLN